MKIFLLLISFSLAVASSAQFPASVDSVYSFIKYNSIHRNKAEWNKTDKAFANCIGNAKTANDTMNCLVAVLKELNDVHSHIFFNNQYYGHYNPVDDSTYKKIKPLLDRSASETGKPVFALLAKKYLYIRLPAIQAWGDDVNRYAQAIIDSICRYSRNKLKGFIVDLRLNKGGNMYPMLSGISPLLGNTITGFETDIRDSVVRQWKLEGNNFYIGGYQVTAVKNSCGANYSALPVAVLIGPVTGSSGSMTAIAFKGRAATVFIGGPTADGYTTSNGYFQFAPNLSMNFATNFVADRAMHIYKTSVPADMPMNSSDNFDDPAADKKVKAALGWLKKKKI